MPRFSLKQLYQNFPAVIDGSLCPAQGKCPKCV
jgi:hypothetical protein